MKFLEFIGYLVELIVEVLLIPIRLVWRGLWEIYDAYRRKM